MKISIITVCYNSEKTIEDTIKSVLNQTYKNYEYLIIDGNSKDNTLEIIKKYEQKFVGKLKYISEKDKGLYDAMNKGINMANGDIIGIINSDDVLAHNDVFEKINQILKNDNFDGVYSDLLFLDDSLTKAVRKFIAHKPSKKYGWHPPHPTLYLKKQVYNKVGNFNVNYRIAADYDFMLRMIKNDYKLNYVKDYFVYMRTGGVSTNGLKGYIQNLKEANLVLKENKIKNPYICNITRIIKTMLQIGNAKIHKKQLMQDFERKNT